MQVVEVSATAEQGLGERCPRNHGCRAISVSNLKKVSDEFAFSFGNVGHDHIRQWGNVADNRGNKSPASRDYCPTGVLRFGEDNPLMTQNASSDPVHDLIRDRIQALKTNPNRVSLEAGFDKSYLRNLLKRPGARPGLGAATAIAKVLRISVSDLTGELPDEEGEVRHVAEPARVSDSLPSVPVRGTMAGSHELGAFQFDGSDVDYVDRYPSLANRPRVYALYVEGDSMFPEHKAGAIRFIDPAAPVRIGDTVVLTVMDFDRGLFAVLGNLAARGEEIVLDKLNPARQISFPRNQVHTIHHVLTDNELAGKG